jgi:hypothetical protein
MTLRADHIGGVLFILGGLLIFALSGDLPFGSLSFPGAGFMPLIIATLMIGMGVLLALGARDSAPFSEIDWSDLPHAALVTIIAAAAIALYTVLGFLIVVPAMMFALLVAIERKSILAAAAYSAGITLMTWWLFDVLRAQLPTGPFGF